MKHSHLLRAGADSQDAFDRVAGPLQGDAEDSVNLVQLTSQLDGKALLAALADDFRGAIKRFDPLNTTFRSDWSTDTIEKVRLRRALDLNAGVSLQSGQPEMRINLGLYLALQDALLDAFCVRGIFVSSTAQTDRPNAYGVLSVGAPSDTRYHDYSEINDLDGDPLARALTRAMPLQPIRLAQADMLLFFALRWVWFHEQAHWILGHLDYLSAKNRLAKTGLKEAELFSNHSEGAETYGEAYCFELQADALATQCLVAETLGLPPADISTPIYEYQLAIETSGTSGTFAPPPNTRSTRFRICLMAAGLCALLFELRRERSGLTSKTHPPPSARIINIALTALSTYGDIAQFEANDGTLHDQAYRTDILRPAANDLMTSLFDLEIIARMVQLKHPLYRSSMLFPEEKSYAPGDVSPLAQDIFDLMLKGSKKAKSLRTEGGVAFAQYHDQSRQLYQALAPYARVSGFR